MIMSEIVRGNRFILPKLVDIVVETNILKQVEYFYVILAALRKSNVVQNNYILIE